VFMNNIERGSTKNQKGSIFVAIGGWTLKTLKFRAYDIQPKKGTNSRCFWVERGGGLCECLCRAAAASGTHSLPVPVLPIFSLGPGLVYEGACEQVEECGVHRGLM
jgi:hypothetical protein